MVLKDSEYLSASIVVLSGVEAKISVTGADLAQIVKDPEITQGPTGVQISSIKNQAVITVTEGKILFEDQSGKDPAVHVLPEIVHRFIGTIARQGVDSFRAYGFNFDIAFDSKDYPTAGQAISERYVDTKAIQNKGGVSVEGAGLKLFFEHSGARCLLNIEPRLEEMTSARFFAHINYHFAIDGPMPPLDDLKLRYQGLSVHFKELLEKLAG